MTLDEINALLTRTLEQFYLKDEYLIINNHSEQAIAHRFARHLEEALNNPDLNVDCEYDRDIEKGNFRKSIFVLTEELKEIGHKIKNQEVMELTVIPDIIIHKRGETAQNTVIIEIKKEYKGRRVDDQFDRLKLRHYTSPMMGNNLNYEYGVYLELDTQTAEKSYRIDYYHNGELIEG